MNERTILFGANHDLIGTVTLPAVAEGGGARLGFLLFNAGIVHRIGPHRINVRLARELAARGIASIRFDLAGHGDSGRPGGEVSFEDQAVIDIRAAMDALADAAKVPRFAIFGYCSGAYHGFATALADERVAAILMFDAYRYPTLRTHARRLVSRLREPRVLQAVIRRITDPGRRAGTRGDRAAPPAPPRLGRIDSIPSKARFAEGLRRLLDRGVRIRMIYSGASLREYNYPGQFADAFRRFGVSGRIRAEFLADLDHVASGLAEQADLRRRIVAWVTDAEGAPA
jgi:pimeloyl-ACP methyl ester carboxylesterase